MKIICVGRNYVDHIKELSNEKPTSPVVFIKPDTAYLENGKDFFYPKFSNDVHYEVELVFRISKIGKNIEARFAHKYIDAIGLGIDFTARDVQSELKTKGLPWEKAKAFDSSAFVSPLRSINNVEEFLNQDICFSLSKNSEFVQNGNSNLMIWGIAELIQDISQYFTLKTGDLIFTGTPSGVGPVKIGDKLEGFLSNEKVFELLIK
jgi:2-keto-4-pentenoate hydratase/2-oxohepta-3-ene-1,7-dioic acid hydratase in catechol pathway